MIALGDSAERVHEKTDHLDNRLVFISALWVALTTAILCAILPAGLPLTKAVGSRSEEHTSELQSLMRISYAVFCLKKKKNKTQTPSKFDIRNHYIKYQEYIQI